MRAVVVDEFGGPDVLRVREIEGPPLGPGQVRVAVHAAGTNPVDTSNRQDGAWAGIRPPVILGYDVSGVVDGVGPGVFALAPGDDVFYMPDFLGNPWGGYAEYHAADAGIVAPKPRSLSYVEAAALPLAGGTAYAVVAQRLAVQQGEWVLIHGAAGGVGSLTVQIAATRGARVIAVASAHHHAILRDLGAEACIDYHDCDVARAAQEIAGVVDAVADFVGGDTVARSLVALHPYGRAATIASLHGDLDLALDRNVTIHGVLVRPDRSVLDRLREMVDAGTVRPLVDTVLPLEGAPEAHRRLESGHGRGKVILRVR